MRRFIIIAGMCILNSAFLYNNVSAAQAIPLSSESQQAIDPTIFDFGDVKAGIKVTHEFELINTSAKIIRLGEVTTSCGCTVSSVSKKVLNPSESTRIKVVFDSEGYEGSVKQFVYVPSDNLDNPVFKFTIKGNVKK